MGRAIGQARRCLPYGADGSAHDGARPIHSADARTSARNADVMYAHVFSSPYVLMRTCSCAFVSWTSVGGRGCHLDSYMALSCPLRQLVAISCIEALSVSQVAEFLHFRSFLSAGPWKRGWLGRACSTLTSRSGDAAYGSTRRRFTLSATHAAPSKRGSSDHLSLATYPAQWQAEYRAG